MPITFAIPELRTSRQEATLGNGAVVKSIPQSNVDTLTGLANRLLFESRLDMALARLRRSGGALVLLVVDLDGFGPINDALGHAAGDELLRQFAMRLNSAFRACDTIARLGGDDFAILVEEPAGISGGEIIARGILNLLAIPFERQGRPIRLAASIGIANCAAGEVLGSKALMQQADAAMHDAKLTPGPCYRSFSRLVANLTLGSEAEEKLEFQERKKPFF